MDRMIVIGGLLVLAVAVSVWALWRSCKDDQKERRRSVRHRNEPFERAMDALERTSESTSIGD